MSSGQVLAPAIFFGVIAAGGVFSSASHSFTAAELARQVKMGNSSLLLCSEDLLPVSLEAASLCGLNRDQVVVFGQGPPWELRSAAGKLIRGEGGQKLEWRRPTDREELKRSLIMLLWSSGTTGVCRSVNSYISST